MGGYYASAGCYEISPGQLVLVCSIARGLYAYYQWDRPIDSFEFPMDTMAQQPGRQSMSHDEMIAMVSAYAKHWYALSLIHI